MNSNPKNKEASDVGASIVAGLLIFGPIVLLIVAFWHLLTTDYFHPFQGVTLQQDVLYATTRQWPLGEREVSPAPLRWLVADGSKVQLQPKPALTQGDDYVIVLVHGYASLEEDVGTYFSQFIDFLRNSGIQARFVVYDWPSLAHHVGQQEMEYWALNDLGNDHSPGPLTWFGRIANHELSGYEIDRRAAASEGAPGLVVLMQELENERPKRITIVAHSMGSYVLTEAIKLAPGAFSAIDRMVFIASDLPADIFDNAAFRTATSGIHQIHVFWSRNDEALSKSEILNGKRLGAYGPLGTSDISNLLSHDSTAALGVGSVHSKYLTTAGAEAVKLSEAVR